ncbi:hypothetical protein LWM68_18355 [Niabella sp. W65]|nr:hypothetical protein [Niabella sp. W65]MCH7364540.1 hypothetical protein [Niabella sp. W65]ULT40401.1 hypothetical protein KRR40_37255 [Niabella sp. I65]
MEEDVLGGDLSRTISLMVPGYDPKKVKLKASRDGKTPRPAKKTYLLQLTSRYRRR